MKTASPGRQRGVALLALLAVAMLAVLWIVLSRLNAASSAATAARRTSNAEVLNQAKQALIGYVAKEVLDLSENIPGRLPCPESPSNAGTVNEGRAGSTCDPTYPVNINIGRLPWRTLGLDKIVDDAAEPLWYVVSPNWVLGSATPVINSGSSGQLNVDGIGNVVAIIIAPGRALSLNPNANQIAAGCSARNQDRGDRSHVPTSLNNPAWTSINISAGTTRVLDPCPGGDIDARPRRRASISPPGQGSRTRVVPAAHRMIPSPASTPTTAIPARGSCFFRGLWVFRHLQTCLRRSRHRRRTLRRVSAGRSSPRTSPSV